jgi:hypothetical protein
VQLHVLLWLVLLQTGWNAATALDLDITGDWAIDIPGQPVRKTLRSVKRRARGAIQSAASDTSDTSPYGVIHRLILHLAPLRKAALARLEFLDRKEAANHASFRGTPIEIIARSPWLRGSRSTAAGLDAMDKLTITRGKPRRGYRHDGTVGTTIVA